MDIKQLLSELSQTDKVVISDSHATLTGKQLAQNIQVLSKRMYEIGIKDKRICLLRMTNRIDSVTTLLAALLNHSVVFVANPHDPIRRVCNILEKFSVYALLTDRATSVTIQKRVSDQHLSLHHLLDDNEFYAGLLQSNDQPISDIDCEMQDADIAIFSSGSTGEPKAILHKIENLLLNAQLHIQSIDLAEEDRVGITLPLYYSYGLVANLFSGLIAKSTIYLNSQIGSIDSEWIKQHKISVLSITPFIAKKLDHFHPSLKKITVGGDILYSKDAGKLLDLYPNSSIYSTYGLTEAGPRVSTHKIDQFLLNQSFIVSLGSPLDGVTLSLQNNETHGELLVNTPTPMLGYFYGKGTQFIPQKGSLIQTGDLYDKRQGEFYFVGREKKIIFQGGEKVFPLMVENAIHSIEGVSDVLVSSSQDQEKGEIAKAYIVINNNLTLQEIKKKLKQQLSRSLIPEQFELVDYIPRSLTGKVQARV
ncbi:MAG: acyl--CoA ligase [Nitrosomonas sp.]|nr:acyl--CoA ligase [Nitrosomonas sp.]